MTTGQNNQNGQPPFSPQTVEFNLSPWQVILTLVLCCVVLEIAFVFIDYTLYFGHPIQIGSIRRLFNMTREDALPALFGTLQTFLAALTLWGIFAVARHLQAARWIILGWAILALFFTYMAIDDGAKVHERIGTAFEKMQEVKPPAGLQTGEDQTSEDAEGEHDRSLYPSYTWQMLFVPFFVLLGLFTFFFLMKTLKTYKARLLILTALTCLALAIGLDFIEGLPKAHPANLYAQIAADSKVTTFTLTHYNRTAYPFIVHCGKSLEEFLEMFAMTLFLAVFLNHLTTMAAQWRIRFVHRTDVDIPNSI